VAPLALLALNNFGPVCYFILPSWLFNHLTPTVASYKVSCARPR